MEIPVPSISTHSAHLYACGGASSLRERKLLVVHLLSIEPVPPIGTFLSIKQLPEPIPIIVVEIALINPSILPLVHAVASLFIHRVMALVRFCVLGIVHVPHSISTPQSLFEIALVKTSVAPFVLAKAFRQSINIFSFIEIPIAKMLAAQPVLQPIFESPHV